MLRLGGVLYWFRFHRLTFFCFVYFVQEKKKKKVKKTLKPTWETEGKQGSLFLESPWCMPPWSCSSSSWSATYRSSIPGWRSRPATCLCGLRGYLKRALGWWPTQFPSWQSCRCSALLLVRPDTNSNCTLSLSLMPKASRNCLVPLFFVSLQEAWPSYPLCSSWSPAFWGTLRSKLRTIRCLPL